MLWQKRAKQKTPIQLDQRSLYALAAVLFLSQLPHILHLPIWVSAIGVGIVALKLLAHHKQSMAINAVLSPIGMTSIALGGAVLVRMHYGYFMGRDPCVAFLFILVSAKFAEVKKPSDSTLLLCLAGFLLLTQYFYSQSILSALITLPAVIALGGYPTRCHPGLLDLYHAQMKSHFVLNSTALHHLQNNATGVDQF